MYYILKDKKSLVVKKSVQFIMFFNKFINVAERNYCFTKLEIVVIV